MPFDRLRVKCDDAVKSKLKPKSKMNLENLKFAITNLNFEINLLSVIHPGGQVLENPGPERSGEGICSESHVCYSHTV
jgi:hypothetical protein